MEEQNQKSRTLVNKILSLKHRDGVHTEYLPLIFQWQHQKCPLKLNVIILNINGDSTIERSWHVKQMYNDGYTGSKDSLKVVPLESDAQIQDGWAILHNSWANKKDPGRLSNPVTATTGSLIQFAGKQ